MEQSRALAALFKAFAAAQAEFENITKDVDSGEGYKTAPLAKFFAEVKSKFKKHGLSFTQDVSSDMLGCVSVRTRIMHQSGQWFQGTWFAVPPKDQSLEERGKAIYNAKKNSLCAIVGLISENEIDGSETKPQSQYVNAETRREIKQAMLDDLKQIADQSDLDSYLKVYEEDIEKMTTDDPTYISDILRDIKALKNKFKAENDTLKGKI